ncbi:hypothetical protein L9F63_000483, partial [Diploptera punctata]
VSRLKYVLHSLLIEESGYSKDNPGMGWAKIAISSFSGMHLRLHPANNTLNSLVDSIKFLFSAYTENMIEVFKLPHQ